MSDVRIKTIDEYIESCPAEVQPRMREMREIIVKAAPTAQEKISWGMATFDYHGNLVHFAAHKKHMGFYPGASGVEAFAERLTEYACSKGAIQLLYSKPLPVKLITEIVKYRVTEQDKLFQLKKSKKTDTENQAH